MLNASISHPCRHQPLQPQLQGCPSLTICLPVCLPVCLPACLPDACMQEAALLQAVALRCRDRDAVVRHDAFAMLVQFPQASLERHLALTDWQTLLDIGLAGPLPCTTGAGGGSKPAPKQQASEVQSAARQLLQQYLGVGASGGGEKSAAADGEEGSGADGHGFGSPGQEEDEQMAEGWEEEEEEEQAAAASWVQKLRALQLPPHAANDGSAATRHLQAAWQEALEQALTQEQLEVASAQTAAQP